MKGENWIKYLLWTWCYHWRDNNFKIFPILNYSLTIYNRTIVLFLFTIVQLCSFSKASILPLQAHAERFFFFWILYSILKKAH
jgi:hypothetical protein